MLRFDRLQKCWVTVLLVQFRLFNLFHTSESSLEHFYGNIDSDENLNRAVDAAGLDGNIVLVAVDGRGSKKHLNSALNTIHNLRHVGRNDNVLLLTGAEEDCRFIASQKVVKVRVCTWSDQLKDPSEWWNRVDGSSASTRIWFLRLVLLDRIMHLDRGGGDGSSVEGEGGAKHRAGGRGRSGSLAVLMTDTDVCFDGNPFTYLESLNKSVVFNGVPDGLNIGLMYARKYEHSPPGAFDIFTEITRRMAAFRMAGINSSRVTGKNARVYWDQNLVNDVMHQWVTNETTYFRSCWIGFGHIGDNSSCFSECCDSPHPFGLQPGRRDEENSMAWFIYKTLVPLMVTENKFLPSITSFKTRPEMAVAQLGTCSRLSKEFVHIEHENQCHNNSNPTKLGWLKAKGCWHEALDSVGSRRR